MAIEVEIVLIAGVVAIGLIVLGKTIILAMTMSRRRAHHLAQQTGNLPVRSGVDIRPPE